MKRKYNKNKAIKFQSEEKLYTKAELNKARVEGWNRAIESLTGQINKFTITSGKLWFLYDDVRGQNNMKERVLKLLKDNIYKG